MRPDPEQHFDNNDPARIIYIGDVRRRKGKPSRALPDRHYLGALLLVAAVAWAAWMTVFLTMPPSRLLTYIAFLAPLGVALAATASLAAYGLDSLREPFPNLGRSARRGTIFAVVAVANLALRAAHHWSLPALVLMTVAALLVDMVRERAAP